MGLDDHVEVREMGVLVALKVDFLCFAEVDIIFFLPVDSFLMCLLHICSNFFVGELLVCGCVGEVLSNTLRIYLDLLMIASHRFLLHLTTMISSWFLMF